MVADTSVHEMPTAEELADIAMQTAAVARRFGFDAARGAAGLFHLRLSRAANAASASSKRCRSWTSAASISNMTAKWRSTWRWIATSWRSIPSARLTDTANVLIMPAIHSASISTKLLQQMGGVSVMGPLLVGLEKSVQIAPLGAKMSEIYNAAVIAALMTSTA